MEAWLSPVLDAEEMRATDGWAIRERGVPSLDLMETAGRAVAEAAAKAAAGRRVAVVCGKGNNGGDGLVVARLLARMGYEAEALLLWPAEELSPDAGANLERIPSARQVSAAELVEALEGASVVVDAIFGTGFSGEPRDPAGAAIDAINASGATVVAVDIASGVNASSGEVEGLAVVADVTVSFHAAKLGHWIAPGKLHTGELRVTPIGIPDGAPVRPGAGLIEPAVLSLPSPRGAESTKFSSGQVVIVGASRGLTGAVCLSASAAIRAGAGYATVAVPAELEQVFEVKLTEVMSVGCASREGSLRRAASEQVMEVVEGAAAVVLGPGIGRDDGTKDLVRQLAKRIEAPLLIDADGLNAHAGRLASLREREHPTVITPHEGELGRLLELDSERIKARRLGCAREAAEQSGAIVVLKGDDTIVTDGERLAVNRGGAPGLATAGTGDVLSGIAGAMLARGVEPFAAACAAVIAHARSGRVAAERVGAAESVIAGDVVESIPAGLAP
ncbi:MAG: NAD(P)H-hydrate dehydratase [Actinobacteria bacterium]|nr:NAD(P)H-hydrate dehydratase [Actinomycetota bacterium]